MNHKSLKCVCIASGDRFRLSRYNPSIESAQTFWSSVKKKIKTPLEICFYTEVHPRMAIVCQGLQ